MIDDANLEKILQFSMSDDESKAYKICLLWDALSRKEFPNYKHVNMRKAGDPRKSLLFKYAYKLVVETRGLLEDKQYRLYIQAQLQILKGCTDGKIHALIDPQCIVGDKAWIRWLMWKKQYESMEKKSTTVVGSSTQNSERIKVELEQTRKFIIEKIGSTPNYDQIERTVRDLVMVKWISLGKVSPYYGLLSPWVKKALGGKTIEQMFAFDLSVYKPSINDEVIGYFKTIFDYEF